MEYRDLSFLRSNFLPLLLGILGIFFIAIGAIYTFTQTNREEPLMLDSGSQSQTNLVVDIQGALINPGVYELASGSRVQDALIAAGGFSADADRTWASRNLNRASKLTDGQKLYIPRVDEAGSPQGTQGVLSGQVSLKTVNINSSSLAELDTLSGVGQVTAQKIIDARPYSSLDDLVTKKIVTLSVFNKIKDKISLY